MSDLIPLGPNTPAPCEDALQSVLEDISDPAILLSLDYRILAYNRAYALHYGKTVRKGKDTCYAISHGYRSPCDENGEACPLAAARASGRKERVFHIHHHPNGPEHVDVELRPLKDSAGAPTGYIEVIRPVQEASADGRGAFVGRSAAFQSLLALLTRVAPAEVPVLLLGESGTGKELCAKAVHDRSARRAGGFVPVECSGLPDALFESELFGHAKGAFTGATSDKPGLVDAAAGGTLFLDEIGDIPLPLQVKLLRLLESSSYRRVGEVTPRRADFRLVCATHRDLRALVAEGRFREDLYFRINVFPVRVPPLRERREDIPLLAEVALRPFGKTLSADAAAHLQTLPFGGNIRELRNILQRAVILADDDVIEPEHLASLGDPAPPLAPARLPAPAGRQAAPWPWGDALLPLDEVEARYLRWAQRHGPAARSALAAQRGLSERTLYRKLRALKQEHPEDP